MHSSNKSYCIEAPDPSPKISFHIIPVLATPLVPDEADSKNVSGVLNLESMFL